MDLIVGNPAVGYGIPGDLNISRYYSLQYPSRQPDTQQREELHEYFVEICEAHRILLACSLSARHGYHPFSSSM